MKNMFDHKPLTEQLDDAILENACPLLESMITSRRAEKKRGYIHSFGNKNNYEVKSYAFLDAHSGNLLPYMFEGMDFMGVLNYLFYKLDGGSANPDNKYTENDVTKF